MEALRRSSVLARQTAEVAGPTPRAGDRGNDIAATFSAEFAKALREGILPSSFGSTFRPEEADLYVPLRSWEAGHRKPEGDFAHEQYLHQLFCPSIADDDPILIMEGAEGVGKTTLVGYYFGCYLPGFLGTEREVGAGVEQGNEKEELPEMVNLYVNVRDEPTREQVMDKVAHTFLRQLERQFKDLTIEDDYAMWDRVVNWASPMHVQAERSFPDRSAYRSQYVAAHFPPDIKFVREALWHLCKQRDNRGRRKYYVSLVFDDLDQQDISVQENLVRMILAWLAGRLRRSGASLEDAATAVDLWKVILPLRGETLRRLVACFDGVQGMHVFRIGIVNSACLLQARATSLAKEIRSLEKCVEADQFLEEDATLVYVPLTPATAADQMAGMLTCDFEAVEEYRVGPLKLTGLSAEFVDDFSNGSIRRFLRLRKRIASSVSLEHGIKHALEQRRAKISSYAFMDALLTGRRDHFEQTDLDNDILNLYHTTRLEGSPYALMIGLHVLYLLRRHVYARRELVNELIKIGYTEAEIHGCLSAMQNCRAIRFPHDHRSDDAPIEAEQGILNAHWSLLSNPAYTDNMAMITPVREDLVSTMALSVSYHRRQFKARARTSLLFLQQIRDDEETVRTWLDGSRRHTSDPQTFQSDLNSLRLPRIYPLVALDYRRALVRIKTQHGGVARVMDNGDWEKLLNDDILLLDENSVFSALEASVES